jgi:hypothetical protein
MAVNKTQHTPGPWQFKSQGEANLFAIINPNNGKWIASFWQNGEMWTHEQEANAKLMATAPELLAEHEKYVFVIEALLERTEGLDEFARTNIKTMLREKKAVIKKATE